MIYLWWSRWLCYRLGAGPGPQKHRNRGVHRAPRRGWMKWLGHFAPRSCWLADVLSWEKWARVTCFTCVYLGLKARFLTRSSKHRGIENVKLTPWECFVIALYFNLWTRWLHGFVCFSPRLSARTVRWFQWTWLMATFFGATYLRFEFLNGFWGLLPASLSTALFRLAVWSGVIGDFESGLEVWGNQPDNPGVNGHGNGEPTIYIHL